MDTRLEKTDHKLLTFKAAAEAIGVPYFKIQRAARQGMIPTYKLLNGRRYVKMRDILERITPAN